MSILDLVAKIEKLPPEKQAEVEDFVEFLLKKNLRQQERRRNLEEGKEW